MISLCIPWRPEPAREAAFARVMDWWETNFGLTAIFADSDPGLPWHLSEARNRAVSQASGVVIIADADTVPEYQAIETALEMAGGCVIYPFGEYVTLPADTVHVEDLESISPVSVNDSSVGGVIVTDTDTYWCLGGMDERFERQWGFEDSAFARAAITLSRVERLPGMVFSFDHPVVGGRVHGEANPNFWRHELYIHCTGNPRLMAELIK